MELGFLSSLPNSTLAVWFGVILIHIAAPISTTPGSAAARQHRPLEPVIKFRGFHDPSSRFRVDSLSS
jgi:hypothetical protein